MRIILNTIYIGLTAVIASAALSGCTVVPPALPTKPPVNQPSAAQQLPARPLKIGLALGGGAARGFAHVGVIQVLEENGIRPDMVVGTSAGSLVGAIYASGKTGAQLQQIAESMDEATFADWTLPVFTRGVIKGEALAKYVNVQVGAKLLENMVLPLGVVATDLATGNAVLFQRGDTGTAVRASSAVPAVFLPVKINGQDYVDGGLVSPVPVRFARQMGAQVIIAVDISSTPENNTFADTFHVLLQTFAIMGRSINSFELRDADIVIRPELAGMKAAEFASRKKAIEAGRMAMLAALPKLKADIKNKTTN
jgi:NTE family protein